jgi:ornithine carbamoyltransferase
MRHFRCLSDLESLTSLLDRADHHKDRRGSTKRTLEGKSIALVFEKASTRTRISLEVAVAELGGHPVVITGTGSQIARGEPVRDTARVLSRMVHAIAFRTSTDARLREMIEFSSVPVLNALTDASHPMQLLADLQTVRRIRGELKSLKFSWIGDGNNMAASWIEAAGIVGFELTLACPPGYDPDAAEVARAKERGARVRVVRNAEEAADGADVLSTDVFTSMGQEAQEKERLAAFRGFQLDASLVARASKDVVVLHCLPAHRGEEITAEVLEGPRSFVWDEAEARLHTSKAVLEWALNVGD